MRIFAYIALGILIAGFPEIGNAGGREQGPSFEQTIQFIKENISLVRYERKASHTMVSGQVNNVARVGSWSFVKSSPEEISLRERKASIDSGQRPDGAWIIQKLRRDAVFIARWSDLNAFVEVRPNPPDELIHDLVVIRIKCLSGRCWKAHVVADGEITDTGKPPVSKGGENDQTTDGIDLRMEDSKVSHRLADAFSHAIQVKGGKMEKPPF